MLKTQMLMCDHLSITMVVLVFHKDLAHSYLVKVVKRVIASGFRDIVKHSEMIKYLRSDYVY
jgi:hypothetical protein